MTREEVMRRGNLARAVMQNEVFRSAFDTCEKKCHDAWADSPVDNPDMRDNAYLMLVAGKAFRDEIGRIVQDIIDLESIIKHEDEHDGRAQL